jgi:hypothetical protein
MTFARTAAVLALSAMLAGCSIWRSPPPQSGRAGDNPLITNPEGTVDTTHGAEGAQTTPR